MASPSRSQVHIFCTVVDNYGDAGVCLRLARHYARRSAQTTLVIDKPDLIDRMMPNWRNEPRLSVQTEAPSLAGSPQPLELTVIEAFQYDAPLDYRIALEELHASGTTVRRIALDYLATESWAANHQGLISADLEVKRALTEKGQPANPAGPAATRKWFAPSFDGQGFPLIHDDFIEATSEQRQQMRARLGASQADDFLVMAFGYPDAPWDELKQAFQSLGQPPGFKQAVFWHPNGLELTQDEFDVALQACDLNFVRGEDSFARAHWASASRWQVPFVWQPYRQDDNAHADKLNGWLTTVGELDLYYKRFSLEFNGLGAGIGPPESWPGVLSAWDRIKAQLGQFGAICRRHGS
jgi:Elongation-Factor P (EF-P) rhamnosyltransferase EarP